LDDVCNFLDKVVTVLPEQVRLGGRIIHDDVNVEIVQHVGVNIVQEDTKFARCNSAPPPPIPPRRPIGAGGGEERAGRAQCP
jgi:hypothetical protein